MKELQVIFVSKKGLFHHRSIYNISKVEIILQKGLRISER